MKVHKPKKDQCKVCNRFKLLNSEQKEKEEHQQHLINKVKVAKLKESFKLQAKLDTTMIAANFDLEAVLYTPCNKVSTIFYSRKLATYNCTIFNLATKSGTCFIWDETEGKRGSYKIGTSLHKYILANDAKHFVFFAESCTGLNRNQYVATILMHTVKSQDVDTIDQIYMVSGHSHMEVESMHAAIERNSEGLKIHTPHEWSVVGAIARRNPYEVFPLDNIVDIRQLKADLGVVELKKNTQGHTVNWMKIK